MLAQTPEAKVATQVILSVFQVNGLLLSAGDALAGEVGLTSARWQVLGAVAIADTPLTVPQIARRMGLTRQSVHATVRRLLADGLVEFQPNLDHQRSPLVRLTSSGAAAYEELHARQIEWSNHLVDGMDRTALETTARTLAQMAERLEPAPHNEGEPG